jgi:hypothetical protein
MRTARLGIGGIPQNAVGLRRIQSSSKTMTPIAHRQAKVSFGSRQNVDEASVDDLFDFLKTVPKSNSNLLPLGTLLIGTLVVLGAAFGLVLIPVGLMLAALGAALMQGKDDRAEPSIKTRSQESGISPAEITKGAELLNSQRVSQPDSEETTKTRNSPVAFSTVDGLETAKSGIKIPPPSDECALGISMKSLPQTWPIEQSQPDSPFHISMLDARPQIPGNSSTQPAFTFNQAVANRGSIPLKEFMDSQEMKQAELLPTHEMEDWRQHPIRLINNSLGFAKSRFMQVLSSLPDLNEELSMPADNRNFAGLTLHQVKFNRIPFPPNTDFRNLNVEGAVAFENCSLPGANFTGIQGPGKITFQNTDLTGAIYDITDPHFVTPQ